MHQPLDILFISEHALWPLDQGFRIRGYHMASALAAMGLRVGIASMAAAPDGGCPALKAMTIDWPRASDADVREMLEGWTGLLMPLRRKLASHQGCDLRQLAGIIPLLKRHAPHTVIGLGQHSPMMLRAVNHRPDTRCVWYAADELVSFHLSCLRREGLAALPHRLHQAALYGALENAFARGLDGAIAVNPADATMLRRVAGPQQVTTIRNGVDLDYFRPDRQKDVNPQHARKLVFWGRMDFEPNIDAAVWFADAVWPTLRKRFGDATWDIVGKHPHPSVQALAKKPGINVLGAVDDLRPFARAASVTILPMRCGGGIKNKLLEAAAMGCAIVASPLAVEGLDHAGRDMPFTICRSTGAWVGEIEKLWNDSAAAARLGEHALSWVKSQHSWPSAAGALVDWLNTFNHKRELRPIEAKAARADPAILPHKEAA